MFQPEVELQAVVLEMIDGMQRIDYEVLPIIRFFEQRKVIEARRPFFMTPKWQLEESFRSAFHFRMTKSSQWRWQRFQV